MYLDYIHPKRSEHSPWHLQHAPSPHFISSTYIPVFEKTHRVQLVLPVGIQTDFVGLILYRSYAGH